MPLAVADFTPWDMCEAVTDVSAVTRSEVAMAAAIWRPVLAMALPWAIMSFGKALTPQVLIGMLANSLTGCLQCAEHGDKQH